MAEIRYSKDGTPIAATDNRGFLQGLPIPYRGFEVSLSRASCYTQGIQWGWQITKEGKSVRCSSGVYDWDCREQLLATARRAVDQLFVATLA